MRAIGFTVVGVLVFVGVSIAACGSSSNSSNPGGTGSGDDGGGDGTTGHGLGNGDGSNVPDGQIACEEQCPTGLVCVQGLCEPPQATCTSNADCEYDSYCAPSGACVPYATAATDDAGVANDPSCKLVSPPGVFAPTLFCQFTPAASDPFPTFMDVQATPIVVNFNKPNANGTPSGPPSIIAPFTVTVPGGYTENQGIIRVLSGADCSLQAALGNGSVFTGYMMSSTTVAVGDLDGDGIAEIVAFTGDDSVVAFTLKAGKWGLLWPGTGTATLTAGGAEFTVSIITGSNWAGPSIHDIDNDGKPEIIVEGYVLDGQTGVLRAPLPSDYTLYDVGTPPVLADLDSNGKAELVNGANVWDFDIATSTWVDDPTYSLTTSSPAGWAAIADFNGVASGAAPQIAVASSSMLYVFNRDHSVYMNMSAVPVPGTGGGPPTIADFDGDGLPEVGLAAADFYTVFDPDCQATPRPGGKCATEGDTDAGVPIQACDTEDPTTRTKNGTEVCPTFVLWSKKTQDHSSNITGSSVFDFAASGTSQVVYADECFARVFDGPTGDVLFSQYHSSCTWLENPVVADVDGDYHSELVVMGNLACTDTTPVSNGIACGDLDQYGVDQSFVGERCLHNQDCASGVCDTGYCRCTTSADCCGAADAGACIEQGLECEPPPAGTPGTGNTCRAPHPHGVQGIRVYKDAQNRWVRSRMNWNQHAYAVTNTNEDGTIPSTSTWASNWQDKTLNNFRQNTPGEADGTDIGDVTAQAGPTFTCTGAGATLQANICNRGTAPLGTNIPVGFYAPGGSDGGAQKACSTATSTALAIGQCTLVSCNWPSPPQSSGSAVDVTVVGNDPNSGTATPVCDTSNNLGLVEQVFCGGTK